MTLPFDYVHIILALATIILTYVLYVKSRQKKELGYMLLSNTSIVSDQHRVAFVPRVSARSGKEPSRPGTQRTCHSPCCSLGRPAAHGARTRSVSQPNSRAGNRPRD